MSGGFASRFVFEAVFLILLAVGAGFADLRPIVIVAVMAGGWVLVSLIEYFAWRASAEITPRPGAFPQRPQEVEQAWSVDEILVPESELEPPEPEQAAPTTVLPAEDTEPEPEPEAEPERPRRRLLRRRKAEAAE